AGAPIHPKHPLHLAAQSRLDRRNYFGDAVVMFEHRDMLVKVARLVRAATECMHLRASEAVEIVKLHRRQWGAQLDELAWRLIKFAAFVVRANDENAHVAR